MIRVRSHDDRGRPVRLARFAPPPPRPADAADSRLRRAAHAVASALYRGLILGPGRWITLVTLLAIALVWLTAEFGPYVIAVTLFSPVSSTIILLVCLAGAATITWHRERALAVKRWCLAASRCPACAYGLAGIEPDADQHVVCPECGAAWAVRDPIYLIPGRPGSKPQVVIVHRDMTTPPTITASTSDSPAPSA